VFGVNLLQLQYFRISQLFYEVVDFCLNNSIDENQFWGKLVYSSGQDLRTKYTLYLAIDSTSRLNLSISLFG
jgi:hypothetical protein